jgi:hypothetical protein
MGMNTAFMVLNDRVHDIARDKNVGKLISDMVAESYSSFPDHVRCGIPIMVGDQMVGIHSGTGISCLSSVHADYTQVVAVGGNTMRRIGTGGGFRSTDEELLRTLASDLGYRLVKK